MIRAAHGGVHAACFSKQGLRKSEALGGVFAVKLGELPGWWKTRCGREVKWFDRSGGRAVVSLRKSHGGEWECRWDVESEIGEKSNLEKKT